MSKGKNPSRFLTTLYRVLVLALLGVIAWSCIRWQLWPAPAPTGLADLRAAMQRDPRAAVDLGLNLPLVCVLGPVEAKMADGEIVDVIGSVSADINDPVQVEIVK